MSTTPSVLASVGKFVLTLYLPEDMQRVLEILAIVFNGSDVAVAVERSTFVFGAIGTGISRAYKVSANGKELLLGIMRTHKTTIYVTEKHEYRDIEAAVKALREYFGVTTNEH